MKAEAAEPLPAVREITVQAGGTQLSGLLAEPADTPPRAVIVALHGGGMRAAYFHAQSAPGLSLLALGAQHGYTVLALDRPGYGLSASALPEGQRLAEQSAVLRDAIDEFTGQYEVGAGFFLVGHSFGGKVALTSAADDGPASYLLGVDVSGVGHSYAHAPPGHDEHRGRRVLALHWGPVRLYPPETFRLTAALARDLPDWEAREVQDWPGIFPEVAAKISVPVRMTFAEYERWWRNDDVSLSAMAKHFTGTRVRMDRVPAAGHNISLGWAARTYHLRVLEFLQECLSGRFRIPRVRAVRPDLGPAEL